MKKFIRTEGTKVTFTHYMPFDEKNGLGKTEDELLKEGYLLDEIPEPQQQEGKVAEAHFSPEQGFWYEYTDVAAPHGTTLSESVKAGIITPEQFRQITGINYTE